MLVGIEGLPDSGKTVLSIKYILQDYLNNRKIISNTPLYGIPYEEFKIDKFLSNENKYRDDLKNATLLLDEITMYMDCRLSSSKSNLMMGYMVLQKRKRSVDVYYTTQDLDLVDYRRLVKYTDAIVDCQKVYVLDKFGQEQELNDFRHYTIIDLRKRHNNTNSFTINITPFFKYYDTNYKIEPLIKVTQKKEKNVK